MNSNPVREQIEIDRIDFEAAKMLIGQCYYLAGKHCMDCQVIKIIMSSVQGMLSGVEKILADPAHPESAETIAENQVKAKDRYEKILRDAYRTVDKMMSAK